MATSLPKVTQYRFFGFSNEKNIPKPEINSSDVSTNSDIPWINGTYTVNGTTKMYNLLTDLGPAVKIGIQALPGTVFYLDGSKDNGIIIDHTGVYELDLSNTTTQLSTLCFDVKSLEKVNLIDNASIIVDILYYPSEGVVTM